MADIVFTCDNCGGELAIDISGSDLTVTCPHCSMYVKVPSAPSHIVIPPANDNSVWRWVLATVSVLIFFGLLVFCINSELDLRRKPLTGFKDIPFSTLTKAAIDLQLQHSKDLSELGLLMTGALWALLIAKKDEAAVVLSDRPEIIMIVCATSLLLSSFIFHTLYMEDIRYMLSVGAKTSAAINDTFIPDVFELRVHHSLGLQLRLLAAGFCIAVVTLISAHRLKGSATS